MSVLQSIATSMSERERDNWLTESKRLVKRSGRKEVGDGKEMKGEMPKQKKKSLKIPKIF